MPIARDDVTVAFAADGPYVDYLLVALTSLLVNAPGFRVLLVVDGMDAPQQAALRSLTSTFKADVEVRTVDPGSFAGLPADGHVTSATWFRVAIPEMVQTRWVLYLDSDLVVDGGLDDLLASAAEGPLLFGVRHAPHLRRRGSYLNAGVLLIDAERWRREQLTEKVRRYGLDKGRRLVMWDQDAINAVVPAQEKGTLEERFNVLWHLHDFRVRKYEKLEGGVHHFSGAVKPWMAWANPVARAAWEKYWRISPVRGFTRMLRTPRTLDEHRMYLSALRKEGRLDEALRAAQQLLARLARRGRGDDDVAAAPRRRTGGSSPSATAPATAAAEPAPEGPGADA